MEAFFCLAMTNTTFWSFCIPIQQKLFKTPTGRDQGTLIATVWKFGLEGHPTLDRKWNLIADYYNPYLKWIDDQVLRIDKDLHIRPELVHVYHHFEDNNWEFWRQLIANAERNRKNCK